MTNPETTPHEGAAPLPVAAAPALARRVASLAYEAMILFGVGLLPGAVGALFVRLLGAEGAWHAETLLRIVAFLIYGIYFVWFWSNGGQTLPMQTWHLRVVTVRGEPLTQRRALARYLAAWAWVVPGWLVGSLAGWHGQAMLAAIGGNIVVYAALALLRADRQFWHDAACGTRLVTVQRSKARPARLRRMVSP